MVARLLYLMRGRRGWPLRPRGHSTTLLFAHEGQAISAALKTESCRTRNDLFRLGFRGKNKKNTFLENEPENLLITQERGQKNEPKRT
jgi:hypothetical protein